MNKSTPKPEEISPASPLCECGNPMINKDKSTPQWQVYDTVCSKCGSRSPQAAAMVREIIVSSFKKGKR
jgi:hypothetical protein